MSPGLWVALAAVVVAVVFGVYRSRTDGRFATVERVEIPNVLAETPYADSLGERLTFVQFSSAFCAPCRATTRVLQHATAERPDVAHVEVDAEQHLELVRRLGILRTPTTLVLDPSGRELSRASGAPTLAQVQALLSA